MSASRGVREPDLALAGEHLLEVLLAGHGDRLHLADVRDQLGRMAAEGGMRLCYHHHMGTGVMFRPEVDRLMNDTDPEFVHLLLDTGHL